MDKEKSITKTIRIKYGLLERLEQIAKENNISKNKLITESLEFALKNIKFSNKKRRSNEKNKRENKKYE